MDKDSFMDWKGRTAFITGASRGIGLAIALRLAREGANIIIAAKTTEPHPKLEGTIFSAAEAIEKAGGRALPIKTDVRSDDEVSAAVEAGVKAFGGIDVLVNNASAIQLSPVEYTDPKRYDLMQDVNVRGTYLCSRTCLPFLKKADAPHILTLSPPIDLAPYWLGGYSPYTLSKYGMTMLSLGMAEEFRSYGIAVNTLWPRTTIATAAVKNLLGGEEMVRASRQPSIVADSAWVILNTTGLEWTGNNFIDEDVLRSTGISDFEIYRIDPDTPLMPDLFLPPLD